MPRKIQAIIFLLLITQLVRSSNFRIDCESTNYCRDEINDYYYCYEGFCRREEFGDDVRDIVGSILIFFISAIANAGGVGGGPMIIPALVSVYKFSSTDSVPMSKITIFAGALTSFASIALARHHTDKNRLLVNYELATLIIPPVLAGTQVGVVLTQLLPNSIICLCLVLFMLYTIVKVYEKYVD
mgnify:CR=1 FL=1